MEMRLLAGQENENNIFSLSFTNKEKINKVTPSRAYKKYKNYSSQYFTEVLIPINNDEINGINYQKFDYNIEKKMKLKEDPNNINIISFFADKEVTSDKLGKFEDINLLTNFEVLFNDHFVCMPYSMNFYVNDYDDIFSKSKELYSSFSSIMTRSNLLGYIPAYINYRDIKKYIEFYSSNSNNSLNYDGRRLNVVPLMIDFKRSNPDSFKRVVAYLLSLKQNYIKEGFYPLYYAYNVTKPRIKDNNVIAKEFLLSFLGFDIIGASNAMFHGWGSYSSKNIIFELQKFEYKYSGGLIPTVESIDNKRKMYEQQTQYLNSIHVNSSENEKYIENELKKRSKALEYIKTINQ